MPKRMTRAARHAVGRSGPNDVTEADVDRMVSESETGYDVGEILRHRGRPRDGSGRVVPTDRR